MFPKSLQARRPQSPLRQQPAVPSRPQSINWTPPSWLRSRPVRSPSTAATTNKRTNRPISIITSRPCTAATSAASATRPSTPWRRSRPTRRSTTSSASNATAATALSSKFISEFYFYFWNTFFRESPPPWNLKLNKLNNRNCNLSEDGFVIEGNKPFCLKHMSKVPVKAPPSPAKVAPQSPAKSAVPPHSPAKGKLSTTPLMEPIRIDTNMRGDSVELRSPNSTSSAFASPANSPVKHSPKPSKSLQSPSKSK